MATCVVCKDSTTGNFQGLFVCVDCYDGGWLLEWIRKGDNGTLKDADQKEYDRWVKVNSVSKAVEALQ